jgi:condensin complex subunit 3
MRGPDSIRIVVLRVVFDLLLMYEKEFFGKSAEMVSTIFPVPSESGCLDIRI